jgi:sterol desaturase/sphingolipid hydroxylase (fatty acid hydroxylase superfamily)
MWFFNYFVGSYFTASTITTCYDLCIGSYKHKERTVDETIKQIKKILPNVIFNLTAITLPYSIVLERYLETKPRNDYSFMVNFILVYLCADVLFYTAHRIFHHHKLYFLHKKHHDYEYPIGLGAMYAHPLDYFLVNLIPYTTPAVVILPPDSTIKIMIIFAIFLTVVQSHGGYTFLSSGHLKHHRFYKVNYGLGPMDRLMGTYR